MIKRKNRWDFLFYYVKKKVYVGFFFPFLIINLFVYSEVQSTYLFMKPMVYVFPFSLGKRGKRKKSKLGE